MLDGYADGGEGYLFLLQGGKLELVASLDDRAPPVDLAGLLSATPENDQLGLHRVVMRTTPQQPTPSCILLILPDNA
jgi:hypothetical protein